MLNIAIVNQWYPPFSYGGVAQYNECLAKGLAADGHNPVVVSSLVKGSEHYTFSDGIHIYRIPIPHIPYWFSKLPVIGRQGRFFRNLFYSHRICEFLSTIVRKHRVDLIEYAEINGEGFFHKKYIPAIPYVVRCHTPYYLLEKTYQINELKFSCRFINWMERRMIQCAAGVTAPSKDLASRIEQWTGLKSGGVQVIPNLIDTNWFHPDPQYREHDILNVLYLGRFERAKGIYVLANAIPIIVKSFPKVKFIFAGGVTRPTELTNLRNYLIKQNVIGFCELTGEVSKSDLLKLYQSCDIFVNPSTIYESFSYTNAEAMSCGKPVVTSDIGGMPETVGDGVGGLVFRSGDSHALAEKLLKLIQSPELRNALGKAALRRASQFNIRKVTNRLVEYYERLTAGQR